MKQYKYIRADDIEQYRDWVLYQVIPAINENQYDMAIIMKEDKPILNEATNEQLIKFLEDKIKECDESMNLSRIDNIRTINRRIAYQEVLDFVKGGKDE